MVRHAITLGLAVSLIVACDSCIQTSWSVPTKNGSFLGPTTTYVCVNVPPAHLAAVDRAIGLWDRALGQWRHLVMINDTATIIGDVRCEAWIHETPDEDPNDPNAVAWASAIGGHEVFLTRGRYEQDVTGIVLHELGHCLGAQHVPGTLMNLGWSPGAFRCPDATTVAQVAAWNRVDLGLLSWCTY